MERIVVVGAGLMGHSIGQEFAAAGYEVFLYDRSSRQLQQSVQRIERNLQRMADWGIFPVNEIQPTMARIHTTAVLEEVVKEVDLVIEAVVENLEVKQRVFQDLDQIFPERTIFGSNTSSFMPSMLASVTKRPDRVAVIHFFYPPHLMPLVEIVRSKWTSDETVNTIHAFLKKAGKSPIVLQKEAMGFLANRLQMALLREASYIVEQGIATVQEVDLAVKKSFGRRLSVVGPFELAELQDGWDIVLAIYKHIVPALNSSTGPSPLIVEKVKRGETGPRAGKGFYEWPAGSIQELEDKIAGTLAEILKCGDVIKP